MEPITSTTPLDAIRAKVGFKKVPDDLGDDHLAFLSFLDWACGEQPGAKMLQRKFLGEKHVTGRADIQECADYIDWLIETKWGGHGATPAPAFTEAIAGVTNV